MAKKIGVFSVIVFIMYALLMYGYLFYYTNTTIPFEYEGTSADPATFLTEKELTLSGQYSRIRNFLFFLATPFEWLFYLFILITGLSIAFHKWAQQTVSIKSVQKIVYLFWLSLFAFIVMFPLNFYRYSLAKSYQISTQTFSSWMKDELIDFWVNLGLMTIIVIVLYWLIQKSKRKWWLYAWLLSIPFTLFLMFIQPVLIDPLYNDFSPLQNKQLEEKILSLADQANIPTKHVFEVNKSEKTNTLNAYVTGIGSNARIVLWDTTLNRLSEEEILFIMAHEMAHYVEKHIYFGIGGYLLLSLFGLYFTNKIMTWIITHYGKPLRITTIQDIRSLPLLLMVLSMLLFAASPLTNLASRYQEVRADTYAIEMTDDPNAAISTFQALTRAGLSEVNPPLLVKIFRYGHPTMLERITMIEAYELQKKNQQ